MIHNYMLFSHLNKGDEFSFEIDDVVTYAMKINDDAWIYHPTLEHNMPRHRVSPLEDEWLVEAL